MYVRFPWALFCLLQAAKEKLYSPKTARFPVPGRVSKEEAETPCEDKRDISAHWTSHSKTSLLSGPPLAQQ